MEMVNVDMEPDAKGHANMAVNGDATRDHSTTDVPSEKFSVASTTAASTADIIGSSSTDLLYYVGDVPPWHICIVNGFQHYIMMFMANLAIPYILAPAMCISSNNPARGRMISTIMFVSGINTLFQSTWGVRLPIVQGGTYSLLVPAIVLLKQPEWKCHANYENSTLEENNAYWIPRMLEVQGGICIGSLLPVFLGATGLIGYLLPYITPLTTAPTLTLILISIFDETADMCGKHWGFAILTIVLIIIFSQFLYHWDIPIFYFKRKEGCKKGQFPFFKLYSILCGLLTVWGICGLLTLTNVFEKGNPVRTDANIKALDDSEWFEVPYPGQWGLPTIGAGAVLGMMVATIAAVMESVGNYYACALMCKAPPPPVDAVNRGILFEGIGCIIGGIFGSGNGTTSHCTNIAVIGITKVGSRRVIQCSALIMLLFSVVPKFGALFVIIPEPIVGGVTCILCGVGAGVGVSYLNDVNMHAPRNMFIFGFSLFFALTLPRWLTRHPGFFDTGNSIADQLLTSLLSIPMFVGGILGFILDNTISGTEEERGVKQWKEQLRSSSEEIGSNCYKLPLFSRLHEKITGFLSHIPFCPKYKQKPFPNIRRCRERQ